MDNPKTPHLDKWLENLPAEEAGTPLLDYLDYLECLNTANCSEGSADFPTPSLDTIPTKSKPQPTVTLTNRRSPHTPDTSQTLPLIETSANTTHEPENLTSSPAVFHALGRVAQEVERDLLTKNLVYGEKAIGSCAKSGPVILSGNNLWELPLEDLEQFLGDAEWRDMKSKVLRSPLQSLEPHTRENECLSLPTLTTGNGTTRNAGRTKLEDRLKKLGIVPNGYQLSPEAMAMYMGFPSDIFDPVIGKSYPQTFGKFPTDYPNETTPDDSQEKQLHQHKRRSPFIGSCSEKKRGRPRGTTGKASGWLVPVVENRQGKLLPTVQGDRVPKSLAFDYPHHFFWFYQYKTYCEERNLWLTKSKRVNPNQVFFIKYLIVGDRPIDEILKTITGHKNG